jgi:hypothetical protein
MAYFRYNLRGLWTIKPDGASLRPRLRNWSIALTSTTGQSGYWRPNKLLSRDWLLSNLPPEVPHDGHIVLVEPFKASDQIHPPPLSLCGTLISQSARPLKHWWDWWGF